MNIKFIIRIINKYNFYDIYTYILIIAIIEK